MSTAVFSFDPVSDLDDYFEKAPRLFAQLQQVYRQHGIEAGYARAVRDQLASLVLYTEEFLQKEHDVTPERRQLVYRFVAHLQNQLIQLAPGKRDRICSA
jgi:hypothetical protein